MAIKVVQSASPPIPLALSPHVIDRLFPFSEHLYLGQFAKDSILGHSATLSCNRSLLRLERLEEAHF